MRRGSRGLRWSATIAVVAAATGLAAVSGFAGTSGAGGEPAPAAFRLEDGTACRMVDASTLACRSSATGDAAVLHADGSSRPADVDVAVDETTPVLLPAESWWNGAFSCRVRDETVTCTAGEGAIRISTAGTGGVL